MATLAPTATVLILAAGQAEAGSSVGSITSPLNRPPEPVEEEAALVVPGLMER